MKLKWILIISFLTMMGWSSAVQAGSGALTLLNSQVTCITFPSEPGDTVIVRGIEFSIDYAYDAGSGAYLWDQADIYGSGYISHPVNISGQGNSVITGGFGVGPLGYFYPYIVTVRLYSPDTLFDDLLHPVGSILGEIVVQGYCDLLPGDPGVTVETLPSSPVPFNPNDGRIHPDAGAPFAAYCVKSGLQVYGIDSQNQGHLVMNIPNETLKAEAPAVNTLLDEAGGIRLYHLAAGGFQINAALSDGKEYVLTWNGCPEVWSHTATFDGVTHPID